MTTFRKLLTTTCVAAGALASAFGLAIEFGVGRRSEKVQDIPEPEL